MKLKSSGLFFFIALLFICALLFILLSFNMNSKEHFYATYSKIGNQSCVPMNLAVSCTSTPKCNQAVGTFYNDKQCKTKNNNSSYNTERTCTNNLCK